MALSLRVLRREKGLTLEALAEQASMTKSYLSKVERGQRTPSVAMAIKLADALGVDVARLFGAQESADVVSVHRAIPRGAEVDADSRYSPIAVDMIGKQMLPFVLHPPADEIECAFREHDGDEFVHVRRGMVELLLPDHRERLKAGDSAYFRGGLPHRFRSVGKEQAEVVVVVAADGAGQH